MKLYMITPVRSYVVINEVGDVYSHYSVGVSVSKGLLRKLHPEFLIERNET